MLRDLNTKTEVTAASETWLGSYGSKWRIQRRAAFSGRTTSGTDKLYQTTFVSDDLAEVAGEILKVCAGRPGLTCTNKNGPDTDIIAELGKVGVYYDHETMRLSGTPK